MLKVVNSTWLYLILSSVVLLWPAFYNGFPIVYSDTSTYLASGFGLETPADRPITYGLFILLTSFNGFSLWTVVFLQSFILSYVIYLLFKYYTNYSNPPLACFICIIILSFTTGLPWVSAMLLPDIFTPVTIIILLLLAFIKELTKTEKIILYILFFLSNAMHLSHLVINAFLIISILLFARISYFKELLRIISAKQIIVLLLISLSAIVITGSAVSKSKHIFYMGRMVENGILKRYLDENCATHNYDICAYKDSLPLNADRFLWDYANSPVYKLGGWKTTKEEFSSIISETLIKPKYIILHIKASVKATAQQFKAFSIGEGNIGFGKETTLYERIERYVPNNIAAYAQSRQTKSELVLFNSFNWVYGIIVYFSLIILIAMISLKKLRSKLSKFQVLFILFTILGIIYNDFVCATLSTIANRFACRVMWLLPLSLIVVVINRLYAKRKKII